MAVKFIENHNNGFLGCWEITEETEHLFSLYNPVEEELEKYRRYRNETRKREWLAARLLLQEMTGSKSKISYDPSGKPVLANTTGHISISHTSGFVVILFHPSLHPGIDIELITRNIERAARSFLSARELAECTFEGRLSNKDLMLRWCAKEAVFKMVPYSNIEFASQIYCTAEPLEAKEGELTAIFSLTGVNLNIPLQFRCIGDLLMVWGFLKI
jgi:phosphopantetheinyl transferase